MWVLRSLAGGEQERQRCGGEWTKKYNEREEERGGKTGRGQMLVEKSKKLGLLYGGPRMPC